MRSGLGRARGLLLVAGLALGIGLPALAEEEPTVKQVDATTIQRRLGYTAFANYGRTRDVANAILMYWGPETRFSENAKGQWAVANKGGVMVNGKPYDRLPGDDVKVVMASNGSWLAASSEAFYHSGTRFEDPEQAGRIFDDALNFQTMAFGNAAPSRTPPRAGPRIEARNGSYVGPGAPVLQQLFPIEVEQELNIDVTLDRDPPFVRRVVLTRAPDDPVRRRSGFPGRFFVGATVVEVEVLMEEKMGKAPRVEVEFADGTRIPASVTSDRNPLYVFRFFPFLAPGANGPAKLEILGDTQNDPPQFGTDLAGNPIPAIEGMSVFTQGIVLDSLAPEPRRVTPGQPGDIQLIPGADEVIAGHEFPRSVIAFVEDYDQPKDQTGAGPTSTADASGIDFGRIGDGTGAIDMKLLDPTGKEIRGTLSSRINALELFLPDVYDPDLGIFPDKDQDGRADPIEGTYRVQLALVDEVGNTITQTLPFGMDATPIPQAALRVSIRPILADPFPNPPDPLPDTGDVAVRRLEAVEVTSPDPDFDFLKSRVKVQSLAAGRFSVPQELKGKLTRQEALLRFDISRDQNGDGRDDFENPAPGQFLPPGVVDPRLGKNDGLYRILVEAFDKAGNPSDITREFTLDTTPPKVGSAFPTENTTQFAPLRIVDVILEDPQAASGSRGSGVRLVSSQLNLQFLGNAQTPAQAIKALTFLHTPNPDDPTRPDFNPDDKFPKLLLEIVDAQGVPVGLPRDGKFDGVYRLDVIARDQAGNEATGSTTFLYLSEPPTPPPTRPALPQPPVPIRMALARP